MEVKALNRHGRRAAKKFVEQNNKVCGDKFFIVPMSEKQKAADPKRIQVWRNRRFLVQVFEEPNLIFRLSISRTEVLPNGDWADGITWDELQKIKSEIGFAEFDAVEVFPAAKDVVNVANMRHLWILPSNLDFAWRNK